MPTMKFYNQLLIFTDLCQYAKNQAILSTFSLDVIYLKNTEFDWVTALMPIL